jgi:glutathione S-transferase
MPGATPVLWHLKVSHYNEKARWALDYKRVPHVRRAMIPGFHPRIAAKLTGGTTFPVLVLDGEAIGDSTRIIAALERRHPDPPLYPADPGDRRRALELEEYFDEELGPQTRLLAIHLMLPDAGLFLGAFASDLRGPPRAVARVMFPLLRGRVRADFKRDDALAYERVHAAGERARAVLGPTGHLVGDAFTVADLTLAALFSPLVAPEQFPYPQPQRGHPRLAPARDAIAAAGLIDWTREVYARYRASSSPSSASTRAAISSRVARTSSSGRPFGSGSSQST